MASEHYLDITTLRRRVRPCSVDEVKSYACSSSDDGFAPA